MGKNKIDFPLILIVVFFIIIIIVGVSIFTTMENKHITGKVVDVIPYDDYFQIFMEDGNNYKIAYGYRLDGIDLSKGNTIVMTIFNINLFWVDDDIWTVESIMTLSTCQT